MAIDPFEGGMYSESQTWRIGFLQIQKKCIHRDRLDGFQ